MGELFPGGARRAKASTSRRLLLEGRLLLNGIRDRAPRACDSNGTPGSPPVFLEDLALTQGPMPAGPSR